MPGHKVFLEDGGEIREGLTCFYCKLVLKDPVQTSESGRRLCRGCYEEAKKDPVYASDGGLDVNDVIRSDVAVKKEIATLRVKCENYNMGCGWKGLFKELMQHSQECQYVTVECSNTGCGQRMLLAKIEAHLKEECLYRQVNCKYCHKKMQFIELQDHAAHKACKNCRRDIPACKVNDHMMLECRHVGCVCREGSVYEVGSARFHDHVKDVDKLADHLEPVICEVTKMSEAFKEMTAAYQLATKRIDILEKDNQGATQRISTLEKYRQEDTQRISNLKERNNELEERIKQVEIVVRKYENSHELLERKVETHEQTIQESSQQFKKFDERIGFLEKRWRNLLSEIDRLKHHTSMAVLSPKQPYFHADPMPYKEEPNPQPRLEERILELEKDVQDLKVLFYEHNHNIAVPPSSVQLEELCSEIKRCNVGNKVLELEIIINAIGAARSSDIERISELELQLQTALACNHNGTMIWHIPEVHQRIQEAKMGHITSICSPPFYTGRNGYKMCLRAYLNGDGSGEGTHLSIFFVLMRGKYDPLLQWPFESKVSLILVDQDHKKHLVQSFKPNSQSSSFQRPKTDMNVASGCPKFTELSTLDNTSYVKDDVMYIKAIVDISKIHRP